MGTIIDYFEGIYQDIKLERKNRNQLLTEVSRIIDHHDTNHIVQRALRSYTKHHPSIVPGVNDIFYDGEILKIVYNHFKNEKKLSLNSKKRKKEIRDLTQKFQPTN